MVARGSGPCLGEMVHGGGWTADGNWPHNLSVPPVAGSRFRKQEDKREVKAWLGLWRLKSKEDPSLDECLATN